MGLGEGVSEPNTGVGGFEEHFRPAAGSIKREGDRNLGNPTGEAREYGDLGASEIGKAINDKKLGFLERSEMPFFNEFAGDPEAAFDVVKLTLSGKFVGGVRRGAVAEALLVGFVNAHQFDDAMGGGRTILGPVLGWGGGIREALELGLKVLGPDFLAFELRDEGDALIKKTSGLGNRTKIGKLATMVEVINDVADQFPAADLADRREGRGGRGQQALDELAEGFDAGIEANGSCVGSEMREDGLLTPARGSEPEGGSEPAFGEFGS